MSSFNRPCRHSSSSRGMSTRNRLPPIEVPWIFRSRRKSAPCSSIFVPNGIMPMIVATPPGRSICEALLRGLSSCRSPRRNTARRPPVRSFTAATASTFDALMVSVAPISFAFSSFDGTVSIAMIRRRPRQRRAVHRRQPDAAAADHRDGAARLDLRRIEHRADAGHHAAADQRGAVQRDARVDLHHGMLVHQHLLGEHREVERLVQHLAFPASAAAPRRAAA